MFVPVLYKRHGLVHMYVTFGRRWYIDEARRALRAEAVCNAKIPLRNQRRCYIPERRIALPGYCSQIECLAPLQQV